MGLTSAEITANSSIRKMIDVANMIKKGALVHYEKKLTKNIIPTDIWQIYTSMFSNLLNIW